MLQAKLFNGTLPPSSNHSTCGDKLHQVFTSTKAELENILSGYVLPDPYFKEGLQKSVQTLMKCLRDPNLPLLELQVNIIHILY